MPVFFLIHKIRMKFDEFTSLVNCVLDRFFSGQMNLGYEFQTLQSKSANVHTYSENNICAKLEFFEKSGSPASKLETFLNMNDSINLRPL